jgi:N-acetylneuraminate epimerase
MVRSPAIILLTLAAVPALGLPAAGCQTPATRPVAWQQLPAIPDPEGFASPFSGVSGGALVVAGGANFPGKRPWEGGVKKWYDSAFVLDSPYGSWKPAGSLPRPTAYGVAVSIDDAVICIGGGDAGRHFRDVFRLTWDGKHLKCASLPDLPRPCAFSCGAVVNHIIYIAGGIETPNATNCLKTFWSMDPGEARPAWRELEPCPGPERMLAVAGATQGSGGAFYLFSGARLTPGPDGKPVREYLHDAWRYAVDGQDKGWKRLADMPRPAVAAPSPAPMSGATRLLVIGGDDGKHVGFKPETEHPGFPRDVLEYDAAADKWGQAGQAPFSRGTVPAVQWRGMTVIPNGEVRPGYRTPEVWGMKDATGTTN